MEILYSDIKICSGNVRCVSTATSVISALFETDVRRIAIPASNQGYIRIGLSLY